MSENVTRFCGHQIACKLAACLNEKTGGGKGEGRGRGVGNVDTDGRVGGQGGRRTGEEAENEPVMLALHVLGVFGACLKESQGPGGGGGGGGGGGKAKALGLLRVVVWQSMHEDDRDRATLEGALDLICIEG